MRRPRSYSSYLTSMLIFIVSLLQIVFYTSCDSTEPGKETLSLSLEEVSCTEVWLKVEGEVNGEFVLKRNNEEVDRITLTGTDNIIYDDPLQPSTTYTYQLSSIQNQVISNRQSVTTMDTTSHNFTWQTFTFGGEGGSSTLYDVAIIDENNIWAVGEIYTADDKYNAVHWDGSDWVLKKILYYGDCSAVMYPPFKAIYAFTEQNIVLTNGGSIGWFDGNTVNLDCRINPFLTGAINAIWGRSSSDLYVVGNDGNISHYNGISWQKIESGTELDLYDISSNKGEEIYVSGGDFMSYDGVVLKGSVSKWEIIKEGKRSGNGELFKPYFIGIAKTIWSSGEGLYFGGNLLHRYKKGNWELVSTFEGNYPGGNLNGKYFGFISQIRGNSENDMILIGEGNTVRHYNGATWKQLGMEYDYSSSYSWLGVELKDDVVAIVGRSTNEAILMILKKN